MSFFGDSSRDYTGQLQTTTVDTITAPRYVGKKILHPASENLDGYETPCVPRAAMTGLYVPISLPLPVTIVRGHRRDRRIAELWCCRVDDHSSPSGAGMLPVFFGEGRPSEDRDMRSFTRTSSIGLSSSSTVKPVASPLMVATRLPDKLHVRGCHHGCISNTRTKRDDASQLYTTTVKAVTALR